MDLYYGRYGIVSLDTLRNPVSDIFPQCLTDRWATSYMTYEPIGVSKPKRFEIRDKTFYFSPRGTLAFDSSSYAIPYF